MLRVTRPNRRAGCGLSCRAVNVILLEPDELRDGRVTLLGRRYEHLVKVLRTQVGDAVSVGAIGAKMGTGVVRALDGARAELEVTLADEPPPPPGVELLLALPRPKILRKVLQSAASMGCKRIALVGSYRVEKSYFSTPFLEPAAIREELVLGLEQGRDTKLPEVSSHRFFKPFIEDELEALFPDTARLLPHPKSTGALPQLEPSRRAVLAIGPEGGWTEYEARRLEEAGFAPFSAGPRILRVDVAVPFLVGQVALRR